MSIEVLVSTMHKDSSQVLEMLELSNIKYNVLVVVQCDYEDYVEIDNNGQRIRIIFSMQRGLSKSRNVAIENCQAEYGYILDDDVVLADGALEDLLERMIHDDVGVATAYFKYMGGGASGAFCDSPYTHNLLTVAKVCSIEICVKISLIKGRILFDEEFGLGSKFPSGEEYIFLTDCLKSGIEVKYYPVCVGFHPDVTSGQDFYTSSQKILAKREMFKRVFGVKSSLYIFAFWAKKLPAVIVAGYFLKFTRVMFLGNV